MSDIRSVAAVATACGESNYTTKDTDTATATTTCPAATDATRAPAAAGAATITIDNFSYGEPLTVSPAQLSGSPITTRPRIPSRHVADRWPVRCAPRRQWGSNVHGTKPAGRVCLLLHISPLDEGHADRPVANLQVARETPSRQLARRARRCADACPGHPAVAQFAHPIAKSRFDIRRRCGRDPFQQLVIPHQGPLR